MSTRRHFESADGVRPAPELTHSENGANADAKSAERLTLGRRRQADVPHLSRPDAGAQADEPSED